MEKQKSDPPESALLAPVESLFDPEKYVRYVEMPLGWRRIDFVCEGIGYCPSWIAVELKVVDWRRALKQAALNYLIADRSYVALWHRYIHRAMERRDLFEHYQVGLIQVGPDGVEELLRFEDTRPSALKWRQRELSLAKLESQKDRSRARYAAIPLLST